MPGDRADCSETVGVRHQPSVTRDERLSTRVSIRGVSRHPLPAVWCLTPPTRVARHRRVATAGRRCPTPDGRAHPHHQVAGPPNASAGPPGTGPRSPHDRGWLSGAGPHPWRPAPNELVTPTCPHRASTVTDRHARGIARREQRRSVPGPTPGARHRTNWRPFLRPTGSCRTRRRSHRSRCSSRRTRHRVTHRRSPRSRPPGRVGSSRSRCPCSHRRTGTQRQSRRLRS
jgi:hypothetical protein